LNTNKEIEGEDTISHLDLLNNSVMPVFKCPILSQFFAAYRKNPLMKSVNSSLLSYFAHNWLKFYNELVKLTQKENEVKVQPSPYTEKDFRGIQDITGFFPTIG